MPSSSKQPAGEDANAVVLSNLTYELSALKLEMATTHEALRKSQEEEQKMARYKTMYLEQVKEAKRVSDAVPHPHVERAAARNQTQVAQDEEMVRCLMQGDLLHRFESEVKVLQDAATASKEPLAEYKTEMETLKKLYDDASKSLAHYRELSWAKGEANKT